MSSWSGETDSGRDGHIGDQTLSAYLDGAIPEAAERERIREHLEECDECRKRLEDLHTVVELLAGLPEPVVPRSFHLTPAMLPSRPATQPTPLPWIIRAQPALRRLTALAAVLLVVLITSDLLVHNRTEPSATLTTSSAPAVSKQSQTSDTTSGASNSGAAARPVAPSAAQATPEAAAAAAARSSPAAVAGSSTAVTAVPSPTPSPTPTPVPAAPATGPPSTSSRAVSPWRLAEIALGTALLALIVVTIAAPRLRARSSRR